MTLLSSSGLLTTKDFHSQLYSSTAQYASDYQTREPFDNHYHVRSTGGRTRVVRLVLMRSMALKAS
jgi:hypothetical protein